MKISKVEFFECDAGWRNWLFVKISTDDGLAGWSECTESHGSARGMRGVVADLEPLVMGKDPFFVDRILWELGAATRQSPGSVVQKALGAIENALLDIKGKALGVPVHQLFGGALREQIPVYWSHWGTTRVRAAHHAGVSPLKNLGDVKKLVSETKERGFSNIKTNMVQFSPEPFVYMPGFNKGLIRGPDLEVPSSVVHQLVEYISCVREAGGPDFGIAVDLNFNLKPEGYVEVARALEPLRLKWIELDVYNPVALRNIRDAIRVPTVSCENLYTVRQYKPYFDHYSMDVASIDVIWNGFGESRKIAQLAEVHEINVTPHNYYSHLSTFMSAHFAAVTPNLKIMEVDVDDVPWKDELTSKSPVIQGGMMKLPEGPGWGVTINEAVLKKYPKRT